MLETYSLRKRSILWKETEIPRGTPFSEVANLHTGDMTELIF